MSSVVGVGRSVDFIVVPDAHRVNCLVNIIRGEADRECGIFFNTSWVAYDNLITIRHISKGEGDLDTILINRQVSIAYIGAPGCSKIDEISSFNIDIVEALASLRNDEGVVEGVRGGVVKVLFDLLAFEVLESSF